MTDKLQTYSVQKIGEQGSRFFEEIKCPGDLGKLSCVMAKPGALKNDKIFSTKSQAAYDSYTCHKI